jgi:hypothetical protein
MERLYQNGGGKYRAKETACPRNRISTEKGLTKRGPADIMAYHKTQTNL